MAEPPDQTPAAGRGHLRASHADRERVVSILKAAFVQGRLDREEFDLRVGQALTSRTYADLAALTADLPARPTRTRPPEPAKKTVSKKAGVAALIGATPALVGLVAGARVLPDATPWPIFLLVIVISGVLLLAVPTGWLCLFLAWLDQRADRQSAQGLPPGPSGQASQRLPPTEPGRQLPPADPGYQQAAEAAPRRGPRRSLQGSRAWRRWRARGPLAGQRAAITPTA